MEKLLSKSNARSNFKIFKPAAQVDNTKTVVDQPFPTVLTDVWISIPEAELCTRIADRHFEIEAVWQNSGIVRLPRINEVATYGFKPAVSGTFANISSFMAVNEYLLTAFAKQAWGLPVLDNVLVSSKKDEYHLLGQINDPSVRIVSGETIVAGLRKEHAQLSWQQFCQTLTKDLSGEGRLQFLQQLWYRILIDGEMHPNQFRLLTDDLQTQLAPFSGVIPKGIYDPNPYDWEWVNQTPVQTPKAFWQQVVALDVALSAFQEVARHGLVQWTEVLPKYIERLQPIINGLRFRKAFRPRGASCAPMWINYLKTQHQKRVKRLAAQGWYAALNLPAPTAGESVS